MRGNSHTERVGEGHDLGRAADLVADVGRAVGVAFHDGRVLEGDAALLLDGTQLA
jgi:hypothetical protein